MREINGGGAVLEIKSKLDRKANVDRGDLRKLDGKLIVDIQGELGIKIGDRQFFREQSLALLELAIALIKWDGKQDFYYYTIEHDEKEGPLLAFLHRGTDYWKLESIWQAYEMINLVNGDGLRKAVNHFLQDFNNQIERDYHFTVERFLRKK